MTFTTKKVSLYGKDTEPNKGVSNAYDSVIQGGIDGNCLLGIFGLRNSGKTYTCSKIVNQAQKTNVYDRIYLITPTFLSNKSYFGKHIDEEDVFEPNRDSIKQVIESVEQDRDDFEKYLQDLEDYNEFMKKLNSKKDLFTDETSGNSNYWRLYYQDNVLNDIVEISQNFVDTYMNNKPYQMFKNVKLTGDIEITSNYQWFNIRNKDISLSK